MPVKAILGNVVLISAPPDAGADGREILQRMIENREDGYRKEHTITIEERSLYREVVQVMDKVQEYLGHGKGRIDLAEVYLKGV